MHISFLESCRLGSCEINVGDIKMVNLLLNRDEKKIKDLKKNIERFNLKHCIVAVTDDGEIIFGDYQIYAYKEMKIDSIYVMVIKSPHKYRKLLKIALNNLISKDFNPNKELFLSVYNPELEISQKQYGYIFGKSITTINRWIPKEYKRNCIKTNGREMKICDNSACPLKEKCVEYNNRQAIVEQWQSNRLTIV